MLRSLKLLSLGLLSGGLGLGLLSSCKDNDDDYQEPKVIITPTLENNQINIPAEGGEQKLSIDTNREWSVSNTAPWISVSPSRGSEGKHTITVKVLPNLGANRTAQITLVAKIKRFTFTVVQAGKGGDIVFEGMPLADFIKKYDKGSDVTLTEDETFQAVVISDYEQSNSTSRKNITVQAGKVGIAVRLASDGTFKRGTLLTFKTKGAKVSRYMGGVLQIDYTGVAGAAEAVKASGDQVEVKPTDLTLADIYTGKHESILVSVQGVQFKNPQGKLNDRASGTKYSALTDCATTPPASVGDLSVAVSAYAKFKGEEMSKLNGTITGILTHSKSGERKNLNLWPRDLSDIAFTGQTCTPSPGPNPDPDPTPATGKLADLLTKLGEVDATGKVINEEFAFEAVLLNNIEANNLVSLKNITVQDGDKGVSLRLKSNVSNKLKAGDVLKVSVKGAKALRYQGGGLQIDFSALDDADTRVSATGKTKAVEPIDAKLSDIYAGKYENVLVKVSGVQIKEAKGKLNERTKGTMYHTLTDCATATLEGVQPLSLPISFHSTYKGEATPTGNGSITGILLLSVFQNKKQFALWSRTFGDLDLKGSRCQEGPVSPDPQPEPQPSEDHPIISAYVEGKGTEKYLQIYNPTAKEIDLSAYSLVLENFSGKNTLVPGDKSLKLTGKLAAGATLVYAHKSANLYTAEGVVKDDVVLNFNGNDNVALYYGKTLVDFIGAAANASGEPQPWLTADKKPAGMDIVLKRKKSVKKPSKSFDEAAQWQRTLYVDYIKTDAGLSFLGKAPEVE